MSAERLARAKDAMVTVGRGRGFLIQSPAWGGPFIVTAAHCLPHLPPAMRMSFSEERTYLKLLAPLGEPPTIAAECVFVDPIADLAVLVAADNQALDEDADAYERLVDGRPALRVGVIRSTTAVWALSLDGRWRSGTAQTPPNARDHCTIRLHDIVAEPGMSGSPIVTSNAHAVGVMTCSAVVGGIPEKQTYEGALAWTLPVWISARRRVVTETGVPTVDPIRDPEGYREALALDAARAAFAKKKAAPGVTHHPGTRRGAGSKNSRTGR